MTTQVATIGTIGGTTARRPSLEELVDRLIEAILASNRETPRTQTVARSVHDARRLRQTGDLDGELAIFTGVDTAQADAREVRWAHAEWLDLVKRRFGEKELATYSQGAGRAAALFPNDDGTLEVLAVLGMRWQPGKILSRRSLRGLRTIGGESKLFVPNLVGPGVGALPLRRFLVRRPGRRHLRR